MATGGGKPMSREPRGDAPSLRESPQLLEALSLWPVYEFRPLFGNEARGREILRYNGGLWTPDDGEYDLAFACLQVVTYVDLPYQRNIVWQGTTGHWSGFDADHPRGNAWHYMTRDGADIHRGRWPREAHPNKRAGDSGMSAMCSKYRSASGRGVRFEDSDPTIKAGLLRERETKRVVTAPAIRVCCYCGPQWEAKAAALPGNRKDGSSPQSNNLKGMKP